MTTSTASNQRDVVTGATGTSGVTGGSATAVPAAVPSTSTTSHRYSVTRRANGAGPLRRSRTLVPVRRRGAVVAGVVVLALLAVLGWVALRGKDVLPFLAPDQCTADVGDHTVVLDPSQARYAGLIAAIAVERGLPARAASIALAAAYQESDLRNLRGGDRDSAGLFQQRPSQGWGSADEVRDPVYATNAFYDALLRVEGYEQLEITVAAQEVQKSGFPDAYADHEADARALASALTGNSPDGFSCRLDDSDDGSTGLKASGL